MYKNSLRNIIYPLIIAVAMIAGIFLGSFFNRTPTVTQSQLRMPAMNNKLSYTLSLIEQIYVDSVNLDSIIETVMPMVVGELDPHSIYIPKSEFAKANETLDGEFDGIGIIFNMATDTAIVINVIPGGPSDKAGVVAGDRIIKVGDSLIAGNKRDQNKVVSMMRGKRGTSVTLQLKRASITPLVPITIERGPIAIKSVTAAFMVSPDAAYVKLAAFSRNTHSELDSALTMLRGEGMKKLIIDLRGNTGGFLDQALLMANDFLPEGKLIVYTEDRHKHREEQYSNGRGKFTDIDLAVLIDEESASSSEIFAGAIQDNDRGTVIGRRSFGKGLVQQQIPFSDGSALRLTVARYYTPTGRSIQRPYTEGAAGIEAYNMDLYNRWMHNEMFSADSIHFADSLKFTTPGGKTVYGGGGIMPDVFVPMDTTDMSKYYIQAMGRNILYRYTITYADKHRDALNKVRSVTELNALLDADTGLVDDFVRYASTQGLKPDAAGIRESKHLITAQLRAYIGRNTALDDTGFYSNIYPIDNVITTAVKTLD